MITCFLTLFVIGISLDLLYEMMHYLVVLTMLLKGRFDGWMQMSNINLPI